MSFDDDEFFNLWKNICAGDTKAFKTLYLMCSRLIYNFAFKRLRDHQHAEDVVIVTMTKVWEQRNSFRGASKFQTWVLGIASHVIVDIYRKCPPAPTELDDEFIYQIPNMEQAILDTIIQEQALVALAECQSQLPERYHFDWKGDKRSLLDVYYWDNMSLEKLSEALQCNVNTLKMHICEARGKIKKCLMKKNIDLASFGNLLNDSSGRG